MTGSKPSDRKVKEILVKFRAYNFLVRPVLISHSDLSLGQYYTHKDLAVNVQDSSHVVPIY
jgi:hypothetical protein